MIKLPPKTYLFAIGILLAVVLFLALGHFSIMAVQDYQAIYFAMLEFIVSWSIIIIFAIMGGVLFGMFLGHRILAVNQFTPFEKEMLEMRSDIRTIKERFDDLEKNEIVSKILFIESRLRAPPAKDGANLLPEGSSEDRPPDESEPEDKPEHETETFAADHLKAGEKRLTKNP